MSAVITQVLKGSAGYKAGIKAGDTLISINGHTVDDVLDYRFYMTDRRLTVEILRNGKTKTVTVKKDEYDDLGLEFETYLMDSHRRCRNNCIFCFVDQMPEGMRESLYFKDDDSRLSFLFGNYITLTALSEKEVDRIIEMHISPINISVHTTNPELRVKMMKNRFAGESLKIMDRLHKAGIKMNCQLVLCPGINDGDELIRSVNDLAAMHPSVESIACVPVGLTKYRENLPELKPYDKTTAGETLDIIERLGMELFVKTGSRIVYPSDEFYLLAERPLPEYDWFEDFPQLENGVGMLTLLERQFEEAMDDAPDKIEDREVAIATGKAASKTIITLVDKAAKKWQNLRCKVYVIENNFFGENVTVAGLITATDLLNQLKGVLKEKELLISQSMLKHGENVFLDDVIIEELSERLNTKITPVTNDGYDLLYAMIGQCEEERM